MPTWDNTAPTAKTIAGITFDNTAPGAAVMSAARNVVNVKTVNMVNGLPSESIVGTTINGHTLAVGDYFLVRAFADPPDTGVYYHADGASPPVRVPELNTAAELEAGVRVDVIAGTEAGISYWLRPAAPITVDTTPLYFDRGGVAIAL